MAILSRVARVMLSSEAGEDMVAWVWDGGWVVVFWGGLCGGG